MTEQKAINTIRLLAADTVQKASSGHPGAPMGMAAMAFALWTKELRYNPKNPHWLGRDRFVLSNGHACALQYVLLHLTGFDEFTMDELKKFRQVGSKTPGHPENALCNGGIEVSTGPLGQGISNAVGLAAAEAHLAATFNKPDFPVIDNYTYVFCGDGCLQEGVSNEASSIAGHLGLGKLIVLYDDNNITIDGETELSFTEDVLVRYQSLGWDTSVVKDGDHDVAGILAAIEKAKSVKDKPSIIKVKTTIGFGSKNQGKEKVHGAALGNEDIAQIKTKWGFDPNVNFHVPPEVAEHFLKQVETGKKHEEAWNQLFKGYSEKYPELSKELLRRMAGKLPDNWKSVLPTWKPTDPEKGTRQFSETIINKLSEVLPELVGGSADLNPSTLTYLKVSKDFQKGSYDGRNFRFGVREHGMAAFLNGLSAYGGLIPFGSTFLNFIGYAMGAVRLSAISDFGVLYIMTHDSIGLGEDGPTHQPIESLMMLRALPGINVLRPGDGNETSGAYAVAIEHRHRPSVLALSRQACANLQGTSIEGVAKGAYIVKEAEGGKPQLTIVGSGSELPLAYKAAEILSDLKVRVVSMPSWELFREQSDEYKESVLIDGVPVLAVEAGSFVGWREYSHSVIAMTSFGTSGPYKEVLKKYGFTAENIAEKARKVFEYYQKVPAHSLVKRAPL